ncbi:MAG: thioredoxin domain-containing protein [Acidobacteria bacterium]|nr:thioredoxin domain-containing protein [Acidobacteriota bacterium]NIM60690.1 thioredoxin domain-containing protein [Acidobacteriota bacterium]NIO58650.1 thioredoxin domain-containing protein [Acidobacteriota bacterium]NIQ29706.1 thioredoxin domain-containing protein [Acidobacteriota bacterium]NIQ84423.1 thioredoxin domain-containing protein [Acidobacteriota bacterium]
MLETYGDKVQLVFRDFPLSFHNNAQISAEAANCAADQGKFWEYHDKLFENQKALDKDNLIKYAGELELDGAAFAECLESGKYTADVRQDLTDGQAAGVTGTPAFFINGRFLNGAVPYEQFAAIIDEELASKGLD